MNLREDEMGFNLSEVLKELWNGIGIILLSAAVVGLLSVLGTKLFTAPRYVSTTKMYVLAQQDTSTLTNGDLQVSTLLTQDYVELIKSRQVTENVIAKLGLNLNHEALLTFGFGDGGGGPTAEHLELLRRSAHGIPGSPNTEIAFAGSFLKRLEDRIAGINPSHPRFRILPHQ